MKYSHVCPLIPLGPPIFAVHIQGAIDERVNLIQQLPIYTWTLQGSRKPENWHPNGGSRYVHYVSTINWWWIRQIFLSHPIGKIFECKRKQIGILWLQTPFVQLVFFLSIEHTTCTWTLRLGVNFQVSQVCFWWLRGSKFRRLEGSGIHDTSINVHNQGFCCDTFVEGNNKIGSGDSIPKVVRKQVGDCFYFPCVPPNAHGYSQKMGDWLKTYNFSNELLSV